ncbi:MAG: alpha/beta fold hydrolase [Solirubrobacterales bacterium]
MSHPAFLLPGGVMPAELAYGALVEALGERADARPKDLELYAGDAPPDDYSLAHEIAGILGEAEAAGFERFHLAGYSAGGASALAFAATYPDRLLTLALLEPAWIGRQRMTTEERELWSELERIMELPDAEMMPAFVRLALRPGVEPAPPPPGPTPPWMAKRPAGLRAVTRTFQAYELDHDALRSFEAPVYYALGALSNPVQYERPAERLAGLFADFTLERFEDRHHFDPPHRAEPERVAASLLALWDRA